MDAELRQVEHDTDWHAYHFIRRHVLYELRGRADYDEHHPDDHNEGHIPLLFLQNGEPVGTVRLDLASQVGTLKMVAVLPAYQRRGIGTAMLQAIERFAAGRGVRQINVHSAQDATAFYERLGWTIIDASKRNPLLAKTIG